MRQDAADLVGYFLAAPAGGLLVRGVIEAPRDDGVLAGH